VLVRTSGRRATHCANRVLAVEDDATMLVVRIESTEAVSAFLSSDE
jgi:hypothetical protein